MLSNDANYDECPEQRIDDHIREDVVAAKIQTIRSPWSLNHYVIGIGGLNLRVEQTAQISIECVDGEEEGEKYQLVGEIGD